MAEAENQSLSILLLNQSWLAQELRSLGHRVVTAGWATDGFDVKFPRLISFNSLLTLLPEGFVPERIVYWDDSHPVNILGLEYASIPAVFFSVDIHHHFRWHRHLASAFDLTLVAQRDYVDDLRSSGIEAEWTPLWTSRVLQPKTERPIPVSFRGTLDPILHPKRSTFFRKLSSLVSIDAGFGRYDEVYSQSKIVINQNVADDVNFRVFEATAAGALLITPRCGNGLGELFTDGVDIVTYEPDNVEDAAAKINYYLQHDAERQHISAQGRAKTMAAHLPQHRAERLSSILQTLCLSDRPAKHYGMAIVYLTSAAVDLAQSKELQEPVVIRSRILLNLAAENLMASVQQGEKLSHDFEYNCLLCKYYLERIGDGNAVLRLGRFLVRCSPHNPLFAISHLEDLRRFAGEVRNLQGLPALEGISAEHMDGLFKLMEVVRRSALG